MITRHDVIWHCIFLSNLPETIYVRSLGHVSYEYIQAISSGPLAQIRTPTYMFILGNFCDVNLSGSFTSDKGSKAIEIKRKPESNNQQKQNKPEEMSI